VALPQPEGRGGYRGPSVTPEDFDDLFTRFLHTAYRLETLPFYDVGDIGQEAERFRAFREGAPIPERSVRTDPWMARIALSTLTEGKQWQRVRVVDDPLTEFERYELLSLAEAQAVGDRNFVVSREVAGPTLPEAWIFDSGTPDAHAVVMEYDDAGAWLGARHVGADMNVYGKELYVIEAAWRRTLRLAVPLNEYLAHGYRDQRVAGRA
jgi:hypothetical protein